MLQQQVYIINTVLMVLDAACVIAAGYGAYYMKSVQTEGLWSMSSNVFVLSVLLVMFANNYVFGKFDLYSDKRPRSHFSLAFSIVKAVAIAFGVLSAFIFLFRQIHYSRAFLLYFAALSLIFILTERILSQLLINRLSEKGFNIRKILVVGDLERGKMVSRLLSDQLSWGHEVIGHLTSEDREADSRPSLGTLKDIQNVCRDYAVDEVLFALDGSRSIDLSGHLETLKKMGITARILPALWSDKEKGLAVERCQGIPFLTLQTDNFDATGLLYKRALDIFAGFWGTLIFTIMLPFLGVAIKLDSPGPLLYKQERVSRHGRIFNIYKFRSMYKDADERKKELAEKNLMNGAMFKLEDDPRITRVGKWLRKTSLDEFPQFWNVLKGEMSLVGTRPPTPEEVKTYQPWHLRRISAKPGITGLWQISGRNEITEFEEVVKLDCKYLDHWRFVDDLKIIFKTILVVLRRKGAL